MLVGTPGAVFSGVAVTATLGLLVPTELVAVAVKL